MIVLDTADCSYKVDPDNDAVTVFQMSILSALGGASECQTEPMASSTFAIGIFGRNAARSTVSPAAMP